MKKKERIVLKKSSKYGAESNKIRKSRHFSDNSFDDSTIEKESKKFITGITKRWATNTLLITALILLVLVFASIFFVVQYYRNYVVSYLSGYANESVTTFFTPYVDGSDDVFNQKAKEFVDGFSDKSRVEVQVIDRNGYVCVSSSGFYSDETYEDLVDVQDAMQSSTGLCKWFGFNKNGEHIVSVAMVLPVSTDGEFSGAVRFITSLKNIDSQIVAFVLIIFLIYIVALFFVALSGVFFIQTIVAAVRKINDTA